MQVVHERAEARLGDAGDGMGDQADVRVLEVRGDLVEVAGGDAHVGVADDDEVVASGARERRELVDLRVEPGSAALQDHAHAARETARAGYRDRVGGVVAIADAEQQLVGGVVERGEALEVGGEIVVEAAERLQDGDAATETRPCGCGERRWTATATSCSA